MSVYPAQFPQRMATYLQGIPDMGKGPKQAQTKNQNVKQASQTMKSNKGDLALR